MAANEDQIKFWNEKAGQEWVTLQVRLDNGIAAVGQALLDFAKVTPGMAVLDVGCGTGTTSLALAGAGAKVTGVDISKPMLGLARQRAASQPVSFVEADAATYPFSPEFDLICSRFGVMFFDAPVAAFANMRRALKPGGRIAFACWRTPPENPWASAPVMAAKPYLPEQPPTDPLAPGPFAFSDPKRVESILAGASFSHIHIEKFDAAMDMGDDLEAATALMLRVGPLSRAAAEVDESARGKILTVVREVLGKFATGGGKIAPPLACWLVAAKA